MSAQNKINLLPDEFGVSTTDKFVKWAVSNGRWVVVLTEFVVICAFLSRFYFDTVLANLFEDIKQKQAIVDSASSFEENFRRVQEKIKIIKSLLAEEKKPSSLIAELSLLLPLDISLTSISVDSKQLTFSGHALSENSLNVLLSGLVSHPRLESINLTSVSTPKDNFPGIDFNISAMVKK